MKSRFRIADATRSTATSSPDPSLYGLGLRALRFDCLHMIGKFGELLAQFTRLGDRILSRASRSVTCSA